MIKGGIREDLPIGNVIEGLALTNNSGGYGEIGLACPVCGAIYVHFNGPAVGIDDDRYPRWELPFWGECPHRWKIILEFHKGALLVTTVRFEDDPQEITGAVADDDNDDSIPLPTPRGALPKMLRWYIIEKFNYTCQYCNRRHHESKIGPDKRPWHIDHVIPLSRGGVDGPENLTLSCERCNLSKRAKHPRDFRP